MKLIFILFFCVSALAEEKVQKSLIIVFDATGSMSDDLAQVRPAMEYVIDTFANHEEKPIKNYILSVFHDPIVDPIIDSADPKDVVAGLNKIVLGQTNDRSHGEVPMDGLLQAIKRDSVLLNSVVFLVTDDGAVDYNLESQILEIVRRKQITVHFLITGSTCSTFTTVYCKVYETIARASGGLTINMQKKQIEAILEKSLTRSLDPDYTELVDIISEVAGKHEENVDIDKSVQEICASVSGKNPKLEVFGPQNEKLKLVSELVMERYRFACVNNTGSGSFRFKVEADSGFTAKIEARSKLRFKFGFSIEPVELRSETEPQPVQNFQNILTIFPSNASHVQTITKAILVTGPKESRKKIAELELTKVNDGAYSSKKFDLPSDSFDIRIEALDFVGVPIRRKITKAPLVSQLGSIPEIQLEETERTFCTNEKFLLKCKVKSQIPVTVQWMLNGAVVKEYSERQGKEFQLTYDSYDVDKKGTYKCTAKNAKGEVSKQMTVQVFKMPKVKISASSFELIENQDYTLTCDGAEIDSKVRWTDENGTTLSEQASFSFFALRKFDEKQISCEVTNGICKDKDTKTFAINYAPTFKDGKIEQIIHKTVKFGDTESLDCSSDRKASKHKLQWFLHTSENKTIEQIENAEKDVVEWKALKASDGVMECRIDNKIKPTIRKFNLITTAAARPTIITSPSNLTFNEDSKVELMCQCLQCMPVLNSSWTYENSSNIKTSSSDRDNDFNTVLTIDKIDRSQAGKLKCRIENNLGNDEAELDIVIQTKPKIQSITLKVDSDVKKVDREIGVEEGKDAEFLCTGEGFPAPKIYWTVNGTKLSEESDTLKIQSASLDHEGFYECFAENVVTSVSKKFKLELEFAPKVRSENFQNLHFSHKTQAAIKCDIFANPEATIEWKFKGSQIFAISESKYEIKDGGKQLEFEASKTDEGLYSCEGSNKFGAISMEFNVTIQTTPTFVKDQNEHIEIKKGSTLEFSCEANAYPPPRVDVIKNGISITNSTNFHKAKIEISDAGIYICVAANDVGRSTKSINVTVVEPPTITSTFANETLIDDGFKEIKCEARGVPNPTLKWMFEGSVVSHNETLKLTTNDSRGFYECIASNSAGADDSKKFYAHIQRLNPYKNIGEVKKELTVKENEDFELLCPYRNYDNIKWSLNNKTLPENLTISTGNELIVKNVNRTHQGTFSCVASDARDTFTFNYKIEVLSAPIIDPFIEFDEKEHEYPPSSDIQEYLIPLGSMMNLSCVANGNPEPVVTWYKSNKKMVEQEFFIDNSVDDKSSGVYTCAAKNSQGVAKKFYKIDVVAAPKLEEKERELFEINVNEQIKLECSMKGSPLPKYFWFKNKERIQDQTSSVLHLNNIQIEDHGKYLCLAFNSYGASQQEFEISVLEAPKIIEPTLDEMIIRNSTFTLTCVVTANPIPKFWWSVDQQVLSSTGNITDDILNELRENTFVNLNAGGRIIKDLNAYRSTYKESKTLKLSKLDSRTFKYDIDITFESSMQGGTFTCQTMNSKGRSSKSIKVQKYVKPSIDDEQQTFFKEKIDKFEGEKLEIECPLTSVPYPTYSWIKNGVQLQDSVLEYKDEGRKLIAKKSSEDQSGNYSCIASNVEGQGMTSIEVIINTKPKIVDKSNTKVTVMKGSSAVLECWAKGTPKPSISWKRKGIGENVGKFLNLKNDDNILVVHNVTFIQNIICTAKNSYGTVQETFTLEPVYAPTFDTMGTERMVSLTEGETFEFECYLTAMPKEKIVWTRDSEEIKANADFSFFTRSRVLRINGAKIEHTGLIQCTASNDYGIITRNFHVKVNPAVDYTPWSEWSECEGRCSTLGTQFRNRRCSFRNPVTETLTCPEKVFEMRGCQMPACWSEWRDWNPKECPPCKTHKNEIIFQGRTRYCKERDNKKCIGETFERRECYIPLCKDLTLDNWTVWSSWRPYQMNECPKCYKSGTKIPQEYRYRSCKSKDWKGCEGKTSEYRNCVGIRVCREGEQWSEWGDWTACSRTCGIGFKRRYRTCNLGNGNCSGKEAETESCNIRKCDRWV